MLETIETDVAILGAGPVGLFAVFELGLLDMKAVLVDALDKPGGQCAELYPDKPIYDIPALPEVSGAELTQRLLQQIKPFAPQLCLGEKVEELKREEDKWHLRTDLGRKIIARVVVIAAGGGSFTPKRLPLEGIEAYEGRSVLYAVRDKGLLKGKEVVIAGGGDSALDWTLALAPLAKRLTLLHRRAEFRAAPASLAAMERLQESGAIDFFLGQVAGVSGENGELQSVTVQKNTGETLDLSCQYLLLFFGLTMQRGPLDSFGLTMEGKHIQVSTETFATNLEGVFAIGDINTYPGKRKLILSGFHEAALMAHAAFSFVHPDRRLRFQYTTTSSSVHAKLGVKP